MGGREARGREVAPCHRGCRSTVECCNRLEGPRRNGSPSIAVLGSPSEDVQDPRDLVVRWRVVITDEQAVADDPVCGRCETGRDRRERGGGGRRDDRGDGSPDSRADRWGLFLRRLELCPADPVEHEKHDLRCVTSRFWQPLRCGLASLRDHAQECRSHRGDARSSVGREHWINVCDATVGGCHGT